jgi:hypothetical protein
LEVGVRVNFAFCSLVALHWGKSHKKKNEEGDEFDKFGLFLRWNQKQNVSFSDSPKWMGAWWRNLKSSRRWRNESAR